MPTKTAIKPEAAAKLVPDGASVMIGGFMCVGTPHRVIDAIVEAAPRGLCVIANDSGLPGQGIGKLITAGLVTRMIVSHIGLNPETQDRMNAGEIDVELVPQGTLVERIRAGGVGLGGVLTPTGIGTRVAEGKRVIEVEGRDFLLEPPIRADVALIAARRADYVGNLEYTLTAQNFNPVLALAADTVIAEPDAIDRWA